VVDDLIFLSKTEDAARMAGLSAKVIGPDKLIDQSAGQPPNVVLIDLNRRSGRALEIIRALKSNPGKGAATVIGYLSHVQTDLAAAAREAGCDVVLPRSAFVQQLPDLLRKLAESEKESI
jgi:DNA-binding NarL/FixJ family response regulator